jgi:hypothetical protein
MNSQDCGLKHASAAILTDLRGERSSMDIGAQPLTHRAVRYVFTYEHDAGTFL